MKKVAKKSGKRRGSGGPRGAATPTPGSLTRVHASMGGLFKDGATVTNATPIKQTVAVAGSVRGGHRFRASVAGTLRYRYTRPDQTTDYTVVPHPAGDANGDVAVVANTEVAVDFVELSGQSGVSVQFTPGATGTITYSDFFLL